MPVATKIFIGREIDVPDAASLYPSAGRAYSRAAHHVSYSPALVRTSFPGKPASFYRSVEILAEMIARGELPEDARFSTSAEAQALWQYHKKQGKDPRAEEDFSDHFDVKDWHAWEETSTGLRVPEGWVGRKDNGTGKYPRTVIETDIAKAVKLLRQGVKWQDIGDSVNKEVAEIHVPYSRGYVVRKVDDVFGIPIEVEVTREHSTPYALHAWIEIETDLDKISGHHDVAVGRGSDWHHGGGGCLDIDAYCKRWSAVSYDCFRPVRGSVPEVSKFALRKTA